MHDLLFVQLGSTAAFVAVGMTLLWLVAARIRDVSFIDAVWGYGMAATALFAWTLVPQPGHRAGVIAAMAAIWGIRLGTHLFIRWRKAGEDPRYAKMLGKAKAQGRYARAAFGVFATQALLLWLTCLPAQLGIFASTAPAPLGPLAWAGGALWLVGIVFETVGDAQLTRFRNDPACKGKVLDTGLWRYTRHPNYFGDACVWWGIWMASADAGWPVAAVGVIGPLFLTFTLTKWSGKPLLEKGLAKSRPGYAEYVARTSGFIPWPPKKG